MASTSGTDSTKRRLFSVAALAILEKAFNAGESDYAEIANRIGENETKERVRGWFTRRKAKAKAPDARLAEVSDAADPGQPSSVQPTDDMAEIEAISAASAQCGCEDPSICLKLPPCKAGSGGVETPGQASARYPRVRRLCR
ncbi:hypothetical protein CYMTET_26690 [Cymbomonas tetramitiformis]|uniref:Homeobox domain-containing protein n=1 Tax=Cymbomonas tetramitiformis TaxID=36881 RepID=A0AAE0FR90_9CHLO|nr:hypothetical protein CYMTET_26690 [Cymbomonas tetramitiformis]